MEDFCYAGGLPVVLKSLAEHDLLNRDVITVNGQTIWDNVKDAENYNPEVIHAFDEPLVANGGIAVLRGNLSPGGALS